MKNTGKTIEEIAQLYSRYREAAQRHPYDFHMKTFLNYCMTQSKDCYFHQDIVDKWCIKHETEANNTFYNRVQLAETIIGFANERKYCNIDIHANVKWHKPHRKLVLLENQEVVRFFQACDEHCFYEAGMFEKRGKCYGLVCKVLFRLLYSNGLRPVEARYLHIDDVDLRNGIVYIKATKGYREHIVVLGPDLQKLLIRYDHSISELVPNRSAFFCNEHGTFLHRMWISDTFRKLWQKYNSSKAVPYDFRYNYAIQNLSKLSGQSMDEAYYKMLAVSRSMGHSSMNQTIYYYSMTPQYSSLLNNLSSAGLSKIIHSLPYEDNKI